MNLFRRAKKFQKIKFTTFLQTLTIFSGENGNVLFYLHYLLCLRETRNALQFTCVFLLVFLPAVSGTSELQIGFIDFNDTHRQKLGLTQFITRMAAWLLLTFFVYLHNQLSSIHSIIEKCHSLD